MPTIYADSSRPDTIKGLKKRGHYIRKANKRKDSIAHGNSKINSYKIHILQSSTNIIDNFQRYRYQVDEETGEVVTRAGVPVPEDKHNHGPDSIRYALTKVSDFKSRLMNLNV